ncbi:MAG TPA: flagellar protein FlgN [Lachnospiraceae bacterium]|nr:flagellar protein FlgN [Lachnospiraceae bacterium]
MASLIENLISVLELESSEYEKLLGLSMQKTPVIISGDLQALQRITDEERDVVSKINHLENKRTEVTNDIANVMNKDVNTLKLVNIIQMLESRPEESRKLAQVHDILKEAVGNMQRVNEQNKELIARSLEMVDFDMNLLQAMNTAPATANYNKGAYCAGSAIGIDVSGFDAKS